MPDETDNLESFDSSCLTEGSWTYTYSGSGDLELEFTDGTRYVYHNVSPLMWANLLRVTSKGWFFNKYVRPKYPFTRLG
jgi:hypothetical protein